MFRRSLLACSLTLVLAGIAIQVVQAEGNWPTFRGADRTAVAPDKGLLTEWPKEGPKLLWQGAGAGRGYASPAIAGGKIFTLGDGLSTADDKDEYLTCFDLKDGKQLWKLKTGKPWFDGKADRKSSRSTPTVDGNRVYALTAEGVLVCADTDGNEKWRIELKKEFGGNKADSWGYSESVLIDGDKLIVTPGGEKNTMVALNKETGDKIWTTSRSGDRGAGHASVVISKIGDVKVYVTTTGSGAMGVRAKDGKLLWTFDIEKTTAVVPTPIIRGDLVFFSAGYKRGGALIKQEATGDGEVKTTTVYGLKPELANKHGGIVLVGDHLYGDSDDAGIPFCAELMTGKILWKSRGAGKGSAAVCAADGHIYIRFADGTLSLVKADPEKLEAVGSLKIPGSGDRPSWSHPVIVDGKLYLREDDAILCYDIKT